MFSLGVPPPENPSSESTCLIVKWLRKLLPERFLTTLPTDFGGEGANGALISEILRGEHFGNVFGTFFEILWKFILLQGVVDFSSC